MAPRPTILMGLGGGLQEFLISQILGSSPIWLKCSILNDSRICFCSCQDSTAFSKRYSFHAGLTKILPPPSQIILLKTCGCNLNKISKPSVCFFLDHLPNLSLFPHLCFFKKYTNSDHNFYSISANSPCKSTVYCFLQPSWNRTWLRTDHWKTLTTQASIDSMWEQ